MTVTAAGNGDHEQQLEAIIADVMHEAVVRFAATNNRLVVLSLFSSGSRPAFLQQTSSKQGMHIEHAVGSRKERAP